MKPNVPLPEYAEVQGLRHLYGIREQLAYKWIRLGLVKSVIVKIDPSAKRGKRLVDLNSVRQLLASQAGNSPAQAGPGCKGRKSIAASSDGTRGSLDSRCPRMS